MIKKRKIGKTNLEITELSMGTAQIGGWPKEVNDKEFISRTIEKHPITTTEECLLEIHKKIRV